jgi:hypothetical protein
VQSPTTPKPATTEVVVERPQGALARGQYAWPAWGIALAGGAGAVLALVILFLRFRAQLAKGDEPGPKSSK